MYIHLYSADELKGTKEGCEKDGSRERERENVMKSGMYYNNVQRCMQKRKWRRGTVYGREPRYQVGGAFLTLVVYSKLKSQ